MQKDSQTARERRDTQRGTESDKEKERERERDRETETEREVPAKYAKYDQ